MLPPDAGGWTMVSVAAVLPLVAGKIRRAAANWR